MKADVYNWKGEKSGSVEVNDAIFAREWSADLVHQVLLAFQANQRRPWAHAKGRGEVRGGGIKPWKQKGTGRSRHGSIRSPIWKGGGASHGPVKDRDFSQKINKKMQRAAIYALLSKKLAEGELRFVDGFSFEKGKTKEVATALKTMYAVKRLSSVLLVSGEKNSSLTRASRNIPKVKSVSGKAINVYDIAVSKNILIDKSAVSEIK
jgi:large subunit ribosomal protein L4